MPAADAPRQGFQKGTHRDSRTGRGSSLMMRARHGDQKPDQSGSTTWGTRLAHEGLEAAHRSSEAAPAGGAAPKVTGHEAPGTRPQGTVGVPLEAGPYPGTAHAPHGRQYTSTAGRLSPLEYFALIALRS